MTYWVLGIFLIHRLFVPVFFFLFTNKSEQAWLLIDMWWLLPVALILHMRKQTTMGPKGSLILGVGLGFCIYEVVLAFVCQHYRGWVQMSHMLSAIPFAFVCLALMTNRRTKNSWKAALGGVLLMLALGSVQYGYFHGPGKKTVVVAKKTKFYPAKKYNPTLVGDCGASEIYIKEDVDVSNFEFALYDCGFKPAVIRLRKDRVLKLSNQTDESANFHLLYYTSDRFKSAWNVLVPANSSRLADSFPDSEEGVYVLYSDKKRKAGFTLILTKELKPPFLVSQKPWTFRKGH